MRLNWQLQLSGYYRLLCVCLAALPLLISLLIPKIWEVQMTLALLAPLLGYSLICNGSKHIRGQHNLLYWQDGKWYFNNDRESFEGNKHHSSIALGFFIYLSIVDNAGLKTGLWLFPDSLKDCYSTGFIPLSPLDSEAESNGTSHGWRHLHTCIKLSEQTTPAV